MTLTNVANWLQKCKSLWLLFIGLLLLAFRVPSIMGFTWTNAGLTTLNRIPVWLFLPNNIQTETTLQAESMLRRAAVYNPKNYSVWRGLGLTLLLQGRETEALSVWQEAQISSAKVLAMQGEYAKSLQSEKEAMVWYKYAVSLDPDLAMAWHGIGVLNENAGRPQKAIRAFERAWSLGNADSADVLAKLFRSDGNHRVAIEVWKQALANFPEHPHRLNWWLGLSNGLRAIADWDAGLQMTESALNEFPKDARLYVELGLAAYYAGDEVDRAIESLQRAIALDKEMALAYAAMGEIMASEGYYDEATAWFSEAIARGPDNSSWHIARANAARASGDLAWSLELFQETIARYPNLASAYYGIALVYQQSNNPDEAVAAIERAVYLVDSPNPSYYVRAGELYEWVGDTKKAFDAYKQALSLDPDNGHAQRALDRLDRDN